jgi:RHS repeat-associated protein
LGSANAITDDKNQVIETYSYKSYGSATIRDSVGAVLAKSVIDNFYFFTARELDAEAGLYYYRARYYDGARGAFTQEDPIGLKSGDSNYYAYVFNAPSRFIDPSGTDAYLVREYLPWLMHDTLYVSDPQKPGEFYVFSFAPVNGLLEAVSLSGISVSAKVAVSRAKQIPIDFYFPVSLYPSLFQGEDFMGVGQKVLESRIQDSARDKVLINFGLSMSVMTSVGYNLYMHNCSDVAREIYSMGDK